MVQNCAAPNAKLGRKVGSLNPLFTMVKCTIAKTGLRDPDFLPIFPGDAAQFCAIGRPMVGHENDP